MMDSSKSKDSSKSGREDSNTDNSDDEKAELCPGFKDADAFVKVSEITKLDAEFWVEVSRHSGNVDVHVG